MFKEGFLTAMGTPLDPSGAVMMESLQKQAEDQINAGAVGLLLFGTMGMGGCVKNSEYRKTLKAVADVVGGRCALLAGASENSLARVAEKLAVCSEEDVDGVVLTPPYYFKTGEANLIRFFEKAASMTPKDFYLYDHEPITKHKITLNMLQKLMGVPNLKGIKSGDFVLIKHLTNHPEREDFTPIFSGSDLFDAAYGYGVKRYLDGIFACMPKSISKVQKCFDRGDFEGAKTTLHEMMQVRDEMIRFGIWPTFSYGMNLLGYPGNFAPDYELGITAEGKKATEAGLARLGER